MKFGIVIYLDLMVKNYLIGWKDLDLIQILYVFSILLSKKFGCFQAFLVPAGNSGHLKLLEYAEKDAIAVTGAEYMDIS